MPSIMDKMGCQAYTFNQFPVFEAIELCAKSGAKVIEFYPGQRLGGNLQGALDQNSPKSVIKAVQDACSANGVRPVAFGVAGLGKVEADNRKLFEFVKALGAETITTEPDASAMDLIEKLAVEYNIKVAIHNHPGSPSNPNYKYWDPKYVLSLVQGRSPLLGACADTGHWVRSNIKPVDAMRILKGRLLGSHLKDLNKFGPGATDVPYGDGVSDIAAILDEFAKQKFTGHFSVEYEINGRGPVEAVGQCIGYARGYCAGRKI
jgi:sugar phosphate isomerase/epimerase